MDTSGNVQASEIPEARLPLIGFIYVASGEVLVEVGDTPFLCQPGQLLLIPQNSPFAIKYFRDAVGYMGGFSPSIMADSKPLRFLSSPLHQGFWYCSFVRSMGEQKKLFAEKGIDLLLSRINPGRETALPSGVSRFLELVFDSERMSGSISYYADKIGISGNYLSRLVKNATGRSVGAWVDIARIQRAKRLLSETRLSVIDVASAVGLEDQSYFSRFFKKETGVTPSAFRKKMQG